MKEKKKSRVFFNCEKFCIQIVRCCFVFDSFAVSNNESENKINIQPDSVFVFSYL